MRTELIFPHGEFFTSTTYNKLFTLHGVIMVWFFLIPAIPNVLGNFLIPIMIGARDMAFPRLNLISWYVFMFGGLFALGSIILGGVDTGWTFYTPLQQHLFERLGHRHGGWHFHQRLLVHFHRTQFHRHDSQATRSRA